MFSAEVRPITTNPGGVVDPRDLVGRDAELSQLLRAMHTGGAKLLGDRRMGKTSLLRKLEATLQDAGHTVIRVSAETNDPETFGRSILDALRANHLLRREWSAWEKEVGGTLALNVGVMGLKLTAKASSGGTARELDLFRQCAEAARRAGPYRTIFIFDEITVLAKALGDRGAGMAEDFLRTLRMPRQQIDGLSMVLAGSIGLHHVVTDLSVVNDLDPVTVGPLEPAAAHHLARCLLRGSHIGQADEAGTAQVIVEQTSAVPFYIHRLVEDLEIRGAANPRPAAIVAVVDDALRTDRWETTHYASRIDDYYGEDADLVRAMLDEYATAGAELGLDSVSARLDAADLESRPTRDQLLGLVSRLEADHYLVRRGAADRFATSLLRRAWCEMRRL